MEYGKQQPLPNNSPKRPPPNNHRFAILYAAAAQQMSACLVNFWEAIIPKHHLGELRLGRTCLRDGRFPAPHVQDAGYSFRGLGLMALQGTSIVDFLQGTTLIGTLNPIDPKPQVPSCNPEIRHAPAFVHAAWKPPGPYDMSTNEGTKGLGCRLKRYCYKQYHLQNILTRETRNETQTPNPNP